MFSKYNGRRLTASMSASAFILAAGVAHATDVVQDEKLNVSAVVGDACTVSAATLAFGQIDPTLNNDQQGTIEIDCVTDTDLGIKLNSGLNGAPGNTRAMKNGSSELNYLLFTDTFAGTAWTDTLQNDVSITGSESVPVFGTTLGTGTAIDGLYTDEVTITLVF